MASLALVEATLLTALAPLLPYYSHEYGLSTFEVGVLSAAYAAGMFAGSLPWAWLASRIGVRRAALGAATIWFLASVGFALSDDTVALYLFRLAQGLGGCGVFVAGFAWLISSMLGDSRGRLIGAGMAASVFGTITGPAVGALGTAIGPRAVFAGMAVVTLALLVWIYATPSNVRGARRQTTGVVARLTTASLAMASWLVAVPAVMIGAVAVLAPLRLDELGWGGGAIGALLVGGASLEALLTYLLGGFSDRFGRAWTIHLGLVLCMVAAVLLSLLPASALLLSVVLVFAFMTAGFLWPPTIAHVSEQAELAGVDQAFGFALTNLSYAGGFVCGASGGAQLSESVGESVPFLVVAVLFAVSLVIARRVVPGVRRTALEPLNLS
ncbi:MAG: transporter, family, putative family transporter protein [Thermoleophilaceae bacterium]|nr:transporter, family, putative family transporter protein [Thermoleophilaceae bacterium]